MANSQFTRRETIYVHMVITTTIRLLFDFHSTAIRRPFDCFSKVIKVTET